MTPLTDGLGDNPMVNPRRLGRVATVLIVAAGVVLAVGREAPAQIFRSAVGGVLIDGDGVVSAPAVTMQLTLESESCDRIQRGS